MASNDSMCRALLEANLILKMRDLWENQIILSHMFNEAVAKNDTDKERVFKSLINNSDKIGDSFARYYGVQIGDEYADLVKEITLDIITFKEIIRINGTYTEIEEKLLYSIDNISKFENNINPAWNLKAREYIWKEYLKFMKSDVTMNQTNRKNNLDNFMNIKIQANIMADSLTEGIIKQYMNATIGLKIDRDECVSCGTCIEETDGLLELDSEDIAVIVEQYRYNDSAHGYIPASLADQATALVEVCPSEAISIF